MNLKKFSLSILSFLLFFSLKAVEVIRINQLGYLPESIKVAVFLSSEEKEYQTFTVHNTLNDKVVFIGKTVKKDAKNWGMKTAFRLDFSKLTSSGGFYLKVGNSRSPDFRIDPTVYKGTAGFILNYMRQQRCGFNPYLNDSCHTHDGIVVDHPTKSGQFIDVIGGWHDATDYLQYSITSVNAVYQMLFAYKNFPDVYGDEFDANGLPGKNGTPDVLDEIRWGLEWMVKMNPAPDEMYSQIADDRDHIGFRLPVGDKANYGLGVYRPVYFVTGKPQGLAKFKNTSTGVSSIAAKFASGFAIGAEVFSKSDPEFSEIMKQKAIDTWEFALSDTGYSQTTCNVSPYYYEEKNYADDLELAAAQLFQLTNEKKYLKEGAFWGNQEPVSPWIKNDTAGHYESFPFINMGHFIMTQNKNNEFAEFYKKGLSQLYERGKEDPFLFGLPFLWCSNNFVNAAITQANLYQKQTGDKHFAEMEAALRDWLFGCNPWGTAMICALPGVFDSPMKPHSSYTVLRGETTPGGLVDGPIETKRNKAQIGIALQEPDEYAPFNNGKAVYHDDIGDYSTNEPTMDGTACLSYYLAMLETEGKKQGGGNKYSNDSQGAVIRINPIEKAVYLTFTADSMFEGGEFVLNTLKDNNIKGSFFFTGNFLRNKNQEAIIREIVSQKHYVGAHSNGHLLYCDWQKRDSTLVDSATFVTDLKRNFSELAKFGIQPENARFFMPPYEWYNKEIVERCHRMGLQVVNFTPGTGTNADYTTPDMKNYKSSDQLFKNLMKFEEQNPDRLNGAVILIHPGTSDLRKDKFYLKLDELIEALKAKGYRFESF